MCKQCYERGFWERMKDKYGPLPFRKMARCDWNELSEIQIKKEEKQCQTIIKVLEEERKS